MRLGLQARFIAVLLLAGVLALCATLGLDRQSQAHDLAVSAAVQTLFDHGGTAVADNEQQQGAVTALVESADHRYRVDMALTFGLLGLLYAGIGWLAWGWVIRPVLGLAEIARRIEAGDEIAPLLDSQRDDEVGDLASAFNTLNDALIAMRRRLDQAEQAVPTTSGGTMVLPAVEDEPATVIAPAPPKIVPPPAALPPPPTPQELERMRRLEDDLREAWPRGEIAIVYQPIHALADGTMRGAEALLRWNHRIDGPISPGEFIPLAERSDVIVKLGRQVPDPGVFRCEPVAWRWHGREQPVHFRQRRAPATARSAAVRIRGGSPAQVRGSPHRGCIWKCRFRCCATARMRSTR